MNSVLSISFNTPDCLIVTIGTVCENQDTSNAKEWGKAAATEWLVICERNGSEHGRDHSFKYHEPTQDELLEALKDLEGWSRATEEHNKDRREHAQRTLPKVKAKLAALLTA